MEAIRDMVKCVPINPVARPELNPELDSIRHHLSAIIAFVNPKSGGQKGRVVLESLKNYLPKENIFDLSKGGPRAGLEEHKDKTNLKIVACGGDGTAGWVLSVLDEMDFGGTLPAISMIPLGTGNDLARTFGWGGGYVDESMSFFLEKVINGLVIKMDRWSIQTKCQVGSSASELDRTAKSNLPLTSLNNYFSIGADSKIALDFHKARDQNPEHFTSQKYNKVEYCKVSFNLYNISVVNHQPWAILLLCQKEL